MRHRTPLPPQLGQVFSTVEAAARGVGRGRRDAADLTRPFHGVRALSAPRDLREKVACYLPRLRPGQRFGGRTALRLWGLPVPWRWHLDEPLDIVVPPGSTPPRARGTRGMRLATERAETWRIDRAPLVDPIAALFQCAADLTVTQAVTLMDALVTASDSYPSLRISSIPITTRDIEQRLSSWGRFPGCATIRRALPHVRAGVESPKETETRLLLVSAGLPEPVVQHEVRENGILIARVDLAYPQRKIAFEYEGDGHRTDRKQWHRDIQRQRALEDLGWIVIRLTQADLAPNAAPFLARARRAVASRGERSETHLPRSGEVRF